MQLIHHGREQHACSAKPLSIPLSTTRVGNTSHPLGGAGWERLLDPVSDLVGRLPDGCGDPSGTAGPPASGGRPLPTGVVALGPPTARETLGSPSSWLTITVAVWVTVGATGAGRGAAPDVSRSPARSLGLRCRSIERC